MKKLCSLALLLCLVCGCLTVPAAAENDLDKFNEMAQSFLIMDTDLSQEQLDELLSQLDALDLEGDEDQNELTGSMVGSGNQSPQMLFAQLQQQLAQSSKEQAMDKLNAVKAAQELAAQTSEYLNMARQAYATAQSGQIPPVPQDLADFMLFNSLYCPPNLSNPELADWEVITMSLENFQERNSSDIQTQMVYIQDYLKQYNSYTSQVNAILNSDSMKGLSGSATMLGMGGAGLAVTALVAGLAVGSLVTALVLRRKQHKA